jgi:hypothetical protein
VVQQITALRGEAQLGVVARDMSYFFCDIEGFTTVRSRPAICLCFLSFRFQFRCFHFRVPFLSARFIAAPRGRCASA